MTDRNTLYPNLKQIAASVREAAGKARCRTCGAEAAKPYVFAYGKKLRQERSSVTHGNTTTTTTTTYYGSLSATAVHLCANCVGDHRRAMATRLWVTIILLALVSLALIVAVIVTPGDQVIPVGLAAILLMTALFIGVRLHIILTEPDQAGLDKALKLHKKQLQKEGYDSFWRDPDRPGRI